MVSAEQDLPVKVKLQTSDEVVMANELVQDDVVGPVSPPYSNHVVEAALNRSRWIIKIQFTLFLKWAIPGLFSLCCLFFTVDSKQMFSIIDYQLLDSNRGPLMS